MEHVFHPNQLAGLAFEQSGDRDTRGLTDHFCDIFRVDFLLQHALPVGLNLVERSCGPGHLALEFRNPAITDLGGLLKVLFALDL